jgi:hypothetical protein
MSENGLHWKPLDWGEDCPRCSGEIEVLTAADEENTAYDMDEVRCIECHAPGSTSCDPDGAWITWQEDDFENGTTDYCKLIRQNKELQAENERLRAELDKLPIADLLRYPAPFRVTLFVDTLEIRDCNGSICPPSIASTVAQSLNVCRAAAESARNNGPEGGE